MARYQDVLPNLGWIHEIARAELHPEAEKLLQFARESDPQQLVEESTIRFLSEMREHFQSFGKVFNAYAEKNSSFQEVKIYGLAQTAADFMLFRNQIKLVVSNSTHGVILFQFSHHQRLPMSINGQNQDLSGTLNAPSGALRTSPELAAQVGPFREVFWTFQGEKVNAEQVAKFYFVEFTRITRIPNRSKGGNQLLLNQIKTLLEEKGFDL